MARRTSLFDALEREWTELTRRRGWVTNYERVATRYGIGRYGTADDVVDKLRSDDRQDDDTILAALLQARPDACAMRVLLQAFLPTIRRIAQHRGGLSAERDELDAALITAAWDRLSTYSLNDRPVRIAANIALDIRKQVVKYLAEPVDVEIHDFTVACTTDRTSDEQLIAAVNQAVTANALTAVDATQLLRYHLGECRIEDIARACDRTWRTARGRLAEHALMIRDSLR